MSNGEGGVEYVIADRIGSIEVTPWTPETNMVRVSVSPADQDRPSLLGGWIARNPENPDDRWYIAPEYFRKHYRMRS